MSISQPGTFDLAGKKVAPEISFEELIACPNKKIAGSIFWLWIINVLLSSGAGKTLKVISVIATRVPYEPQISLLKS